MTIQYSPAVECYEIPGTKVEKASAFNGISCSVQLMCLWDERWDLVDDIMGNPRTWPYVTTGFTPAPVEATLREWPQGAKWGTDGAEQACSFEFAAVQFDYSSQLLENAVETIEPSMEAMPLDHRLFTWGTGNGQSLAENEAPPRILRSLIFGRTRYNLGALPATFLSAIGCTNDAPYSSASLGITFATDTLLYLPAPASRSFYNVGAGGYTATFKFAYKPDGWNKYWRASTQTNSPLYLPDGATRYWAYQQIDFSDFWL